MQILWTHNRLTHDVAVGREAREIIVAKAGTVLALVVLATACSSAPPSKTEIKVYSSNLLINDLKSLREEVPSPDGRVGWKRIHIEVTTDSSGAGNSVPFSDCVKLAPSQGYIRQATLVRSLSTSNAVNPRCVVGFTDFRKKFALGTPIFEPTKMCVDVYVSSPSGMLNYGTATLTCEAYAYPVTGIIPTSEGADNVQ